MISKINISSLNNQNTPNFELKNKAKRPSFNGGLGDLLISGVQKCEQHPMLNVSVLDLATAIVPRTIVETYSGSKKKDENGNPILDEMVNRNVN